MKISEIEDDFRHYLQIPQFKADSKTVAVVEKGMKENGPGVPPPDLEEIIERARSALDNGEKIPSRDLRPLAGEILRFCQDDEEKEFVRRVLGELEKHGTGRDFSALLGSYVIYFDSKNENCRKAAEVIARNKDSLNRLWSRSLKKIDLLDVGNVEKKIADALRNEGRGVFAEIGFLGAHASGALARKSWSASRS